MTKTAADVAERMAGMLVNHPKAQYLRITREEAEALATLRKDPAPTLTLPLPLRDFKGGTFHDGAAALLLKVLGTDVAVADYVGTDPTTGGYAGYADQQLVSTTSRPCGTASTTCSPASAERPRGWRPTTEPTAYPDPAGRMASILLAG